MEDKSSSNASPSPLDATRRSSDETPTPSAAFTPGPWITETTARFVWIGPRKAAWPKVADVVTGIACDGLSAQAEAKVFANARLIAAAPDLLGTLQSVRETLKLTRRGIDELQDRRIALENVDAALAQIDAAIDRAATTTPPAPRKTTAMESHNHSEGEG